MGIEDLDNGMRFKGKKWKLEGIEEVGCDLKIVHWDWERKKMVFFLLWEIEKREECEEDFSFSVW